jgi:hypothetical protein
MTWPKEKVGKQILSLLQHAGVDVPEEEAMRLREDGVATICGYNCKSANVHGASSCRVVVCRSWFGPRGDFAKPRIKPRTNTSHVEFDFQLFPTQKYLFALYYRALRDYALQLAVDRDKWFSKPYWGMEVDIQRGLFVWREDHTKQFPLLVVSSLLDLDLRVRQYRAQSALVPQSA